MPNGTNFGMATLTYGTNEDYFVHFIAILKIIEKKGLASEIKVAWDAILKVRREMKPYFQFPKDETEAAKELQKQTLSKYKETLKTKKVFTVAKTQRHSKCSVCSLSAIRKPSGTRLSTKCTPRTPGSELTEVPTRALVLVPGCPFWTALSSTS
jgi:hypothetical protein